MHADMGTLFRQTAAAALASTPGDKRVAPVPVRDVVRRVDEAAARPVDDVVIREDHGHLVGRLVKQPLGKLRQQAVVVADDREELSAAESARKFQLPARPSLRGVFR